MITEPKRTTKNHRPAPACAPAQPLQEAPPVAITLDPANTAAAALLRLEAELRSANTTSELAYILANEPRGITRAQQIAVIKRVTTGQFRVSAVTGISRVDSAAPLILWFEELLHRLTRESRAETPQELHVSGFATAYASVRDSYPLPFLLWLPFIDKQGTCFGGLLQARSVPWSENDIIIGKHIAGAGSQAHLALINGRKMASMAWLSSPKTAIFGGLVASALALIPVSMTALAPVEVAPRAAFIVTAGIDGVVETVTVAPNANVAKGEVLLRTTDITLRNRLEISEREVNVAESRVKKSQQMSFADARGRHDLAVAQAELDLKRAEREYAREMLSRTEIRAERDGVVLFSDVKDLIGKPVAVGEKLMEIADPNAIEFRVDLPLRDAIVLRAGARVKVFLDSDPINPVEAVVARADYKARMRDNQELAFRLIALSSGDGSMPRLGVRGTAQVYSDRVALIFYLLRRPFAAVRQWTGL